MAESKDYTGRALGEALTTAGTALRYMSDALRRFAERTAPQEDNHV